MPKTLLTFRIDDALTARVDAIVGEGRRTAFVEECFVALVERRLVIYAEPAPDVVLDGKTVPVPVAY